MRDAPLVYPEELPACRRRPAGTLTAGGPPQASCADNGVARLLRLLPRWPVA
jgi:hypothetical protein